MLPVIICRHYNVSWVDSRTCHCLDCGKQGQWTKQGFAIWIRTPTAKAHARAFKAEQRAKVA